MPHVQLATAAPVVATLANPTPAANDFFGYSVAVSGNTVVVGAPYEDAGFGNSGNDREHRQRVRLVHGT